MKTLLAASLALALSGGAAFAQLGYWTNGNASIYGGGYVPQWHDRSNAGEAVHATRAPIRAAEHELHIAVDRQYRVYELLLTWKS